MFKNFAFIRHFSRTILILKYHIFIITTFNIPWSLITTFNMPWSFNPNLLEKYNMPWAFNTKFLRQKPLFFKYHIWHLYLNAAPSLRFFYRKLIGASRVRVHRRFRLFLPKEMKCSYFFSYPFADESICLFWEIYFPKTLQKLRYKFTAVCTFL